MNKNKAKILIVDDLPENLHAMQVILDSLDADIITADSGNAALAQMIEHDFAVVLLDVQMPEMDGFEAAGLMQSNQATRDVPIIFVTAINKDETHIFKGYETGAVDYLFKPVNPDILLSKVKVFLNLHNAKCEIEDMQQELQKSRNLESLGVLAGGLAHDFNNILAAILGNIGLAKIKTNQQETQIISLLGEAEKASIRAKDLTQQLLTFSKGGEPLKEIASIASVIQDSAGFIMHGSNVKCTYQFADNLWQVNIDKGQIGQVVQNIILNATQAMPDGGSITVICDNIEQQEESRSTIPRGKYVKISIKDSGTGIAKNLMAKIFDPYVSTKASGSGLGLAITHSIIKKHQGHIAVESDNSNGTTFTIHLPATGIQHTQEASPPEVSMISGLGKIMVMDDDEMVLSIAQRLLEHLGYEVVSARDGQEAVACYSAALESEPIHLVIMDLTIPGGMGGKEAVMEILKLNPKAKVIVSSGYSNDPIMANCQDYGFCASIVKPYQLKELQKVLDECMSLHKVCCNK